MDQAKSSHYAVNDVTMNIFLCVCGLFLSFVCLCVCVCVQVVEILTHVSKRLRSRPEILLPMAALLEQFTSSDSAPQVVVSDSHWHVAMPASVVLYISYAPYYPPARACASRGYAISVGDRYRL